MTMKLYSLLFGLSFALLISGAHMAKLNFKNNCPYTVWPGTLTGSGAQLSNTGFQLGSQKTNSIDVPRPWVAGRVWARTGCSTNSGKFACATADCGPNMACNGAGGVPPATLAEFTLGQPGGTDTFDVSLVDGFNLPLSIAPQGGSGNTCKTTSCSAKNIISDCPSQLAAKGPGGNTIACKSACEVFKQVQYCCKPNDTPQTCPPTNYAKFFKDRCPQAYSYAKDDPSSTFTCNGGPDYLITFCP